jgi:hypothetical protein
MFGVALFHTAKTLQHEHHRRHCAAMKLDPGHFLRRKMIRFRVCRIPDIPHAATASGLVSRTVVISELAMIHLLCGADLFLLDLVSHQTHSCRCRCSWPLQNAALVPYPDT